MCGQKDSTVCWIGGCQWAVIAYQFACSVFSAYWEGLHVWGFLGGVCATPCVDPSEHAVNIGGTDCHSEIAEVDGVSAFAGLDDCGVLFAAGHGRGALDPVPGVGGWMVAATSLGVPPPVIGPELVNPMEGMMSIHGVVHSGQGEQVSLLGGALQPWVVSPGSGMVGEGAAIFADVAETVLGVLDGWVAVLPGSQQWIEGLSLDGGQVGGMQDREPKSSIQKEGCPDLFLPVVENCRMGDYFHGCSDGLFAGGDPMVLVELDDLSCRCEVSVYAVGGVWQCCVWWVQCGMWGVPGGLQLCLNANMLWQRMGVGPPVGMPYLELLMWLPLLQSLPLLHGDHMCL